MRFIAIFLISIFFAASAFAQPQRQSPDLLTFGVGEFDVLDNHEAGEFVVEYRWQTPLFWKISPLVGVMATTDAGFYGYGGLQADFYLSDNWILNPNFAVGGYHRGSGKDLGHGLEFRSGIELDYQFQNYSRAGIAFNHISNASLGDANPGTESLLFTYSLPLSHFGW